MIGLLEKKRNKIPQSVINRAALSGIIDGVMDRYIKAFSDKHHLHFEGWSGIVKGGKAIFNQNRYYIDFFAIKIDMDLGLSPGVLEEWLNSGSKKLDFGSWLLLQS